MAFAELLAHSCFSFLEGASQPEELVEQAHRLGLSALALCDRDGLYGSVRAHVRARELGQRLIVGAELSLARQGEVVEREGSARRSKAPVALGERARVALLARTGAGYANLCRLLTLAHAGLPKGESVLEHDWLGRHAEGLVAVVPAPEFPGSDARAGSGMPAHVLETLADALPEHTLVAAVRRLDGLDRVRLAAVTAWSARYGFPIVASARPFFHEEARRALADVLYCTRVGTTLEQAGTALLGNAARALRSEEQMLRLFPRHPEWVGRSAEVAGEVCYSLSELRYRFPCELAPGETADGKLRALVAEGAERRYPSGTPEAVRTQLEKELALIAKLGMASYFLSTWEIVEIARRRRILCQGRGSAANSAVCFVLGITAVDPARSHLLFERFMSEERTEPPDIDIDFEHERREEVIQEIYARYGRDRAAMVSEVICYRGKSALREVAKAFGLPSEQQAQLTRLSFAPPGAPEPGAAEARSAAPHTVAALREAGLDPEDERLRQILELSRQLRGFPRHLSVHVGGFVLSAEPLAAVAPIEPARMVGRTVIPWDKDDIEALGFFKVDVLGLGMLTAIRKCLELAADEPERFDPLEALARLPPEDPAVYELIASADTVGVFQIESRAQMAMLPRLRPERFYDLVVEVALVRPGPIQGGMVHPYLRRRNGEEPVDYPHPSLSAILARTLGVPLFQEQVMQLAIVGAGYSGGEADALRRDMAAWKKTGRLLRHRERLLAGFAARGVAPAFAEALFEQIKGFGEYGFPESHAASFALLVYSSAWQKRHLPAHFACALLNAQPMGFYSPSSLVSDAKRHGVEVRDVCVNESAWDCTLEARDGRGGREDRDGRDGRDGRQGCDRRERSASSAAGRAEAALPGASNSASPGLGARFALRLGFRLVKGLGQGAGQRLVAARGAGRFETLDEVVRRARLKKDEVEALAEAGAFGALVPERRAALWQAAAPRVGGLFDGKALPEPAVALPRMSARTQLCFDYARKGLSVSDHPFRHLRDALATRGVRRAEELRLLRGGASVAVAGLVLARQRPETASGVVFVTLEDETGVVNLVLFARVFERFHFVARHARLLLAVGRLERHVAPAVPRGVLEAERLATGGDAPPLTSGPRSRASVPVLHVVVETLESLDAEAPGAAAFPPSRDFH